MPAFTVVAAKPDFSDLAGSYRAKYDANLTGTTVKGNVDIEISVPTNGSKAVMEVIGHARAESANLTVALLGRTTFKASKKMSTDNIFTAFYAKLPARSKFKGVGKRFRYNVTLTNSPAGSGEMSYVLKVGRRSISIVGNGSFASNPAIVKIEGTRTKR